MKWYKIQKCWYLETNKMAQNKNEKRTDENKIKYADTDI